MVLQIQRYPVPLGLRVINRRLLPNPVLETVLMSAGAIGRKSRHLDGAVETFRPQRLKSHDQIKIFPLELHLVPASPNTLPLTLSHQYLIRLIMVRLS